MPVKTNMSLDFPHFLSAQMRERLARVGTPTRRPHNGRLARRHQMAVRAALAVRPAPPIPATPARRAIARAQVEFDQRELEALRAWLARYARLLTG
jgi:hypothetical protein